MFVTNAVLQDARRREEEFELDDSGSDDSYDTYDSEDDPNNNKLSKAAQAAEKEKKFENFWLGVKYGLNAFERKHDERDEFFRLTEKIEAEKSIRRSVFMPDGNMKLIWDVLVGMFIIYSIIFAPYQLAFQPGGNITNEIEFVLTAVFFVDILVNFNTAVSLGRSSKVSPSWTSSKRLFTIHYCSFWYLNSSSTAVISS